MAEVFLVPPDEEVALLLTAGPTLATTAEAPGLDDDDEEADEAPEPAPPEPPEAEVDAATAVAALVAFLLLSDAALALIMVALVALSAARRDVGRRKWRRCGAGAAGAPEQIGQRVVALCHGRSEGSE